MIYGIESTLLCFDTPSFATVFSSAKCSAIIRIEHLLTFSSNFDSLYKFLLLVSDQEWEENTNFQL